MKEISVEQVRYAASFFENENWYIRLILERRGSAY